LFAVLRRRYQDLADRVVGSIVMAEDHLTEEALLAAARVLRRRQPRAGAVALE
jgi:DNA-directed RNA polymerase specialized sigma24 family protein